MLIEKAKEILRKKEEEKRREEDAIITLKKSEIEEQQRREEEIKQEKIRKVEEFKKKIPSNFCKPLAKCWNCGKLVELNNNKAVEVVDGYFRVVECPSCESFVIDRLIFTGAENIDSLLPYCLKMK